MPIDRVYVLFVLCAFLVVSKCYFVDLEQYDISDVVKVVEIKKPKDEWSNYNYKYKRLIGTAVQRRWTLTTAHAFVIKSSGFWDSPNVTVTTKNIRILSADGEWKINYGRTWEPEKIVIHPNFKFGHTSKYNFALLHSTAEVCRSFVQYYLNSWNFHMMTPAFIFGVRRDKLEKISVKMDHGLHECPCFIRHQAYSAICMFDMERAPGRCEVIDGSPLFLSGKKEISGKLIGFTDSYYSLDECSYKTFDGAACVNPRQFFAATSLCSLFNFINLTIYKEYYPYDCLACRPRHFLSIFIVATSHILFS